MCVPLTTQIHAGPLRTSLRLLLPFSLSSFRLPLGGAPLLFLSLPALLSSSRLGHWDRPRSPARTRGRRLHLLTGTLLVAGFAVLHVRAHEPSMLV